MGDIGIKEKHGNYYISIRVYNGVVSREDGKITIT